MGMAGKPADWKTARRRLSSVYNEPWCSTTRIAGRSAAARLPLRSASAVSARVWPELNRWVIVGCVNRTSRGLVDSNAAGSTIVSAAPIAAIASRFAGSPGSYQPRRAAGLRFDARPALNSSSLTSCVNGLPPARAKWAYWAPREKKWAVPKIESLSVSSAGPSAPFSRAARVLPLGSTSSAANPNGSTAVTGLPLA